jgi:tRNA modification GTPase
VPQMRAEPLAETIFALASAPGRGGVAVVRVSGPMALDAVAALTRQRVPAPRRAVVRALINPGDGSDIDQALVLTFASPASFTGESVAEFHVHGGRAVTTALLSCLAALPGLRPAEAGEFTRRAFENGKLDLTQAEAVADLVDADTAAQQRQAMRQLQGTLGALYGSWSERLARALAHLEAEIDFPDEDLPDGLSVAVQAPVAAVLADMRAHLADGHRGERLREGCDVAILGAPNAGKSSLMNLLARRDVAIVSDRAGTTRDVIEVELDLGGLPVRLCDTAGLREASDSLEAEGIRRALARAEAADLKLALFDAKALPELDATTLALVDSDTLVVVSRADLAPCPLPQTIAGRPALVLAARSGLGLAGLLEQVQEAVAARLTGGGSAVLTRARHRQAVSEAVAGLARALSAPLPELAAEDVRLALRALGRITGRVDVEDLLDMIFREFCIGK